ncbi:hypothetical protein EWM64_g1528 [Hericium alpestre]|uniref:Uncharacterized protein n=1 Tax=Hericium alpestre TaxID=135208 RepID=A0A4Z0A620_9AGAM|nr:hypothetical protein EWM64_g1528 [Hericium alpestre]
MSGDNSGSSIDGRGLTNLPEEAMTENAKNTFTSASVASTASTEPLFEEGDYPIPRLFSSCEYILRPDGSEFTPQFLQAVHISMILRGVTLKSSDRIFCLPDDQEVAAIPLTQSLAVAQKAIDAFKAEQDASKLPDQSMSTDSSASVQSEYKNRRTAIVRPDNGKLWNLRDRQVTYTTPKPLRKIANRDILCDLVAETSGPERAQASKETRLGQSQDAPTAHADVNVVAGPSNTRIAPLRLPANSGTQGAGPSKKCVFDQVQDEPVASDEVASPSKKQGAGPRGRPVLSAAQDASFSNERRLESSGDSPEAGAPVDKAAADPSNEEVARRLTETATGNAKKPGQVSRKGKERAH